jgi:hypothetical protein
MSMGYNHEIYIKFYLLAKGKSFTTSSHETVSNPQTSTTAQVRN